MGESSATRQRIYLVVPFGASPVGGLKARNSLFLGTDVSGWRGKHGFTRMGGKPTGR